jgi:hypothetical protein
VSAAMVKLGTLKSLFTLVCAAMFPYETHVSAIMKESRWIP